MSILKVKKNRSTSKKSSSGNKSGLFAKKPQTENEALGSDDASQYLNFEVPEINKRSHFVPFVLIMMATFATTYGLSQYFKINPKVLSSLIGIKDQVKPTAVEKSKTVGRAYFEIKVLSDSNEPVANAIVKIGRKIVGKTDVFGEWRKFAKVSFGSTYNISVEITSQNQKIKSSKNFAVAYDLTDDTEFKHTFILSTRQTEKVKPQEAIDPMKSSKSPALKQQKMSVSTYSPKQVETPAQGSREVEFVKDQISNFDDLEKRTKKVLADLGARKQALVSKLEKMKPSITDVREETSSALSPEPRTSEKPLNQKVAGSEESSAKAAVLIDDSQQKSAPLAGGQQFEILPKTVWVRSLDGHMNPKLSNVVSNIKKHVFLEGLALEKAAAFQIVVSNLKSRTGSFDTDLVRVGLETNGQEFTSFLRNYNSDPMVTAKSVVMATARHLVRNMKVTYSQGKWVINTAGIAKAWLPFGRSFVYNSSGQAFSLVATSQGGDKARELYFGAGQLSPCPGKTSCYVSTRTPSQGAPVTGWSLQKIVLSGDMPTGAEIYATGYKTFKKDDAFYYWGPKNSFSFITVAANGDVVYRNKIYNGLEGIANISLPSLPIARK